jgi:hypothetical protein
MLCCELAFNELPSARGHGVTWHWILCLKRDDAYSMNPCYVVHQDLSKIRQNLLT